MSDNGKYLDRSMFESATADATKEIDLPGMGKAVIGLFTERQVSALSAGLNHPDPHRKQRAFEGIRRQVIAWGLRNPTEPAKRLLDDKEIGMVGKLPAPVAIKLFDEIIAFNGLDKDADLAELSGN